MEAERAVLGGHPCLRSGVVTAMGSVFRNARGYLERYFAQVAALERALQARGDRLWLVLVEGDSVDGTLADLRARAKRHEASVVERHHGGPEFGSIDHPQRWRQLAHACNGVLSRIRDDGLAVDALIYVESDLVWEPDTMIRLLGRLSTSVRAVAAMCFAGGPGGPFYDTWGHVKDGIRFGPWPPYHPGLADVEPGALVPIDSAGSCVVLGGEVAMDQEIAFAPEDCIRGLCRSIRARGHTLWLDPSSEVYHPC